VKLALSALTLAATVNNEITRIRTIKAKLNLGKSRPSKHILTIDIKKIVKRE
jgi:hypothetical protein